MEELLSRIRQRGVQRLFLDGVDGLSRGALYPERQGDVLTALTNELRAHDVTAVLSVGNEVLGRSILPLEPASGLVENTIVLRFVELRSRLHRLISVLKLRGGEHDPTLRESRSRLEGWRSPPASRAPRRS